MNPILEWDGWLFQQVNQHWTAAFLDWLFPILTDLHRHPHPLFLTVLGAVLFYWGYKHKHRALHALMASLLAFAASDLICYRVIKSLVNRDRPEKAQLSAVLRVHSHSGQSFPSNHSANMFAVANTLALFYPPARVWAFAAAGAVAYSRVYVGVHYPTDVLAGAAIGLIVSTLIWLIYTSLLVRYRHFRQMRHLKQRF